MRNCPICLSPKQSEIHSLILTNGDLQTILSCDVCGMVYADSPPVDYSNSIYSMTCAIGSGMTETDRDKLDETARQIRDLHVPLDAAILDVGCAQGGLLAALRELGYTNLTGMDPDLECVNAVYTKKFNTYAGTLADPPVAQYDFIILSHVLEHLLHPRQAMEQLAARLKPEGRVYIEVPDATRYTDYDAPFLDFNSEHINHFSRASLRNLFLQTGFLQTACGEKTLRMSNANGADLAGYPAMWAVIKKPYLIHEFTRGDIKNYISKSSVQMEKINTHLNQELAKSHKVNLWGANSYCGNILSLPAIKTRMVDQVVDRNPAFWGKVVGEERVRGPHNLTSSFPIVITSLMAIDSIKADIAKMGLANRVISIPREVYE